MAEPFALKCRLLISHSQGDACSRLLNVIDNWFYQADTDKAVIQAHYDVGLQSAWFSDCLFHALLQTKRI
jgi:hypothetical protein